MDKTYEILIQIFIINLNNNKTYLTLIYITQSFSTCFDSTLLLNT